MKPSQGRIVIFRQPDAEALHNGSHEHPAIVNHVWGDGEFPALNLTVFPDCAPPQSRTSVPHKSVAAAGSCWWDWPKREVA
jgi:hypothetical protein